jgi:reactive intermediate/imine deaminase
MTNLQLIHCPQLPAPAGHYAHATVHAGTVYVAGLLPITLAGPLPANAPFDAQAQAVLDNLVHVLHASGSRLDLLLRCTCYITDIDLWPRFNAIYAERLGPHRPARTVVPVAQLHYGYSLEVDAIAAVMARG